MSTQTGIFRDVPDAEYRDIEAHGSSVVKTAAMLSVAHAKIRTPDSPAMFKGRLAHCMVLEWTEVDDRYEQQLEGHGSSKAVKEDKARILANGKTPVTKSDWDLVEGACRSAHGDPTIDAILEIGAPEVTIVWKEKTTGLMCKARIDWLREHRNEAYDLKTTSTFGGASPTIWERNVPRYGLGIQAVHYLDGLSEVTGQVWEWRWLALELTPPFATAIYQMGADAYASGLSGWTRGISRLHESEKAGRNLTWPRHTYTVRG